jgi:hypothetical protein
MVMDSKGNIIVTGQSHGTGTHWDYATIKYSSDGDSLWVRRYNGPSSLFPGDYAYAIAADDEDNIYVTGRSDGDDSINNNAQCVTIAYSPEGDTLWENRYPLRDFAGYDVMYSEGFIYVVALSYNNGVDLIKYDKQGNTIWIVNAFTFGSPVHPAKLAEDIDGYIYLSSVKNLSYAVLKISSSGSIVWEFQYPTSPNPGSFVTSMAVDLKKNIYLTGQSIGWVCPGENYDYLTLKLSQDKVNVSSNSELVSNYLLSQNYPNPFNPVTTISYEIPTSSLVTLTVYDITGKEIAMLVNEIKPAGKHNISFDGINLASRVYLYKIESSKFVQVKRMILMK